MSVVVVGVGSNLGAREASIHAARALLQARDGIEVREVSAIYETEALGPPQPRYLNAAFRLETTLCPAALLHALLRTERRLGRHRGPDERWGPRSVDLDLLWDQRGPYELPGLRVPHVELENRGFALAPLLDVAPELKPVFDSSLARLDDRPTVWTRAASIRARTVGGVFEVDVEADSLQDACALCIGELPSSGRPWSTCHLSIEPGPEHLAAALRDLFRIGFSVQRATISHCSQWQWLVELHGANMGIVRDVDVGLRTTSATTREVGAHLSFQMTHR